MIELGEVTSAPGQPSDDNPWAGFDRRVVRKLLLIVTTVCCVLTVTGSVRPEPRNVRSLWSVAMSDSDGATFTNDTLFLHHVFEGEGHLTAYDIGTGAVRWSRSTAGTADTMGYLQPAVAAGMLLLPADRRTMLPADGSPIVEYNSQTVALDAATGRQRWKAPGDVQAIHGDTALMADYTEKAELHRLRLVRLRDHSTIWSRETPGVRNQFVALAGLQPDKIVTATDAGEIRVFRYADGKQLTSVRIPWLATRPQDGLFTDMTATGGYLAVSRSRPQRTDLTVYRLDTLAVVWSASDAGGYTFPCGRSLCFNEGAKLVAHDPATGRQRWQVTGAFNAWSVTDERLVLQDGDQEVLVDAASGAVVGERAQGEAVLSTEPGPALFLLGATESSPDRTSVTRWDLATGRLHLLGAIDRPLDYRCQAVGSYLTCLSRGRLDVTAIGLPVTDAG